MDGYDAATYGERWADVYDDWYDDPAEVADVVTSAGDLLGAPAGAGCLLELGIGTGRLALPLAALGYDVRGVDASPAMLARLRAKPGGDAIPVAVGDMADVPVPAREGDPPDREPRCAGVLAASNAFFGIVTADAQQRCLRRVHDVLEPGGWLAVAAFVPAERLRHDGGGTVGVRSMSVDRVVLTADRSDAAGQTVSGQFIDITEQGVKLRPYHIRYLWPEQIDGLAAGAGLALAVRWASWKRDAFDVTSSSHVSVYRRADDRPSGQGQGR